MRAKILLMALALILVGGCTMGSVHMGAADASDAHSLCMSQMVQRQMTPLQEQQFMHRCMAGYGYGANSTQSTKPFTVPMPNDDQQH